MAKHRIQILKSIDTNSRKQAREIDNKLGICHAVAGIITVDNRNVTSAESDTYEYYTQITFTFMINNFICI